MKSRLVVALTAAALLLAGCANADPEGAATPTALAPTRAPSGNGQDSNPDPDATPSTPSTPKAPPSADEVADTVTRTWWQLDGTVDDSPVDAHRRAAGHLTEHFAEANTQDLPGNPGDWWNQLVADKAHYKVAVTEADTAMAADLPDDTPHRATRARIAELTPTNDDGPTGDPRIVVMTIDLYREAEDQPWLVDDMQVDEAQDLSTSPQDFG
ncbi:hypothetical protein ACQFYA_20890 [Promicromonospora sp. Marseille-Q5078]